MGTQEGRYDVLVLGGGLAGLTLALQLKRARPDTSIAVAEKRVGPAPEAAFKVGESTAEPSAHYFREVLSMGGHLRKQQLRKAGLRFFFPSGDNSDITHRVEYGSQFYAPVATYQLDRGRLENELAERCRASGVDVLDGAFVNEIELGDDTHAATIVRGGPGGERSRLEGRWLVDAAGRSFLLKRKLGLEQEVGHTINAAWFRLRNGIEVDKWADDPGWLARVDVPGLRQFSTNHLMGEGYWVWMIQLASGPISIGIVADPRFHPFDTFNDFDKALAWIGEHEPQLAGVLEQRRDELEDFLKIENFAHGAKQVYSADRWVTTGEAGVFSDPLYSPGSDFISYSNTLVTDLVTRDLDGEDIAERAERHNREYLRFFEIALSYYEDQYRFYGNPQVMIPKLMWDHTTYWGYYSLLFLRDKMQDLEFMAAIEPETVRFGELMRRTQGFFREWHELSSQEWAGVAIGPYNVDFLVEIFGDLAQPFTDAELKAKIRQDLERCEGIAVAVFAKAASQLPNAQSFTDVKINPYAISLDPKRWEADGLFDPPGLTPAEARALVPGYELSFIDELGESPELKHFFTTQGVVAG